MTYTARVPIGAQATTGAPQLATVLLLVGIAATALFLSLWRLDTASWNSGELIYRDAARRYVRGDYSANLEHPLLAKQLYGRSMEVLGNDRWGTRLLPALLGLTTGILLVALGARLGGLAVGVAAGALWWLLPQAPPVLVGRLDRYGLLEPPALLLDAAALLAAWWWATSGRAHAAALAGLAIGLAASAKLAGVLALPAVLLPVLWVSRPLLVRAAQAVAALAAAVVGFLLPYLASGDGWTHAMSDAVLRQGRHAVRGHDQLVAGTVYLHPPWWANLWWQREYLGTVGVVALWLATLGLALAWRPHRRAVVFVAAALLVPVLVVSLSPLKLPHYHLVWAAPQALAAGFGLVAAWRRGGGWRLVALALVAALAVPVAGTVRTTATLQPGDYETAARFLHDQRLDRTSVLVNGYRDVARAYLPRAKLVIRPPGAAPKVIIVDSFVADRRTQSELGHYIAGVLGRYRAQRFGRVVVYVRDV